MSKPAKSLPRFKTEAQERAYWEAEGRDSTQHLDWTKAQSVVLPNLKPSTKTISLRLPQHLLDAIKAAANARDVPYQSLIKVHNIDPVRAPSSSLAFECFGIPGLARPAGQPLAHITAQSASLASRSRSCSSIRRSASRTTSLAEV